MLRKSHLESRQPQKAPNFAVIWMKGIEKPEIINTVTGKPEQGISVVSKRKLINKFVTLCGNISSVTGICGVPQTYAEAKDAVRRYTVSITISVVVTFNFFSTQNLYFIYCFTRFINWKD